MRVANLMLCDELYKLSHWEMDKRPHTGLLGKAPFPPGYDLGYLLRKLPNKRVKLRNYTSGWKCQWSEDFKDHGRRIRDYEAEADNPEDATAKLCIELIKQGILKP